MVREWIPVGFLVDVEDFDGEWVWVLMLVLMTGSLEAGSCALLVPAMAVWVGKGLWSFSGAGGRCALVRSPSVDDLVVATGMLATATEGLLFSW